MGDGRHITSLRNRVHSYIKTISGKIAHIPLFIVSDEDGQVVGVTKNKLDVHLADTHENPVNRYFVETTTTTDTLNGALSSGDQQIVVNGTVFANGDWLDIVDGNTREPNYIQVVSGGGTNTLVLDREIDNDYSDGSDVTKVNPNFALTDGSVTPVSFRVTPKPGEVFHCIRILMAQIDSTDFSTNGWWGNTALVNGLHIRYSINGVIKTNTLWKKNADIIEDAFDWAPIDKPPAGKFGARTRYTLERSKSFVRLVGGDGDYYEILVQDDLTDGEDMQIKLQGHLEE